VSIVTDQVASPTLADNLAEMLLALGLSRAPGVFHTAGASVLSRYEFARLAAETFDLDASLIGPVTTASLGQLAPRPLRSGLKVERFRSAFRGVPVLSAAEGLIALRRQAQSVDIA
jgi:dTDP-4-dehydrorhamnose reductase